MKYRWIAIFLLLSLTYSESMNSTVRKENFVDLIVTEDSSPWLIPIFTPVVAIHEEHPILLSTNNRSEVDKVIEMISAKKCAYAGDEISYFEEVIDVKSFTEKTAVENAAKIIRHFWKRSEKLIFVTMKTPNAVIQASIMGAIYGVPVVPIDIAINDSEESQAKYKKLLSGLLRDLQVEKTMIMGRVPLWITRLKSSQRYTSFEVNKSIITNYGGKKIRNVIISRMPRRRYLNDCEWIAPYLSLMRRAPVYFTNSPFVHDLEANFATYVKKAKITPKTITLLGSDSRIYTKHIRIPVVDDEDYEMAIEPFSLPRENRALNYGVGRIPFDDLEKSSLLIAKGFIHELLAKKMKAKVLLAANPSSELLLGETISRVTAEEFKNFNLNIKEYYSVNYDEEEIRKEVEDAQLVIYEGHVTDQTIFVPPGGGNDGFGFFDDENGERRFAEEPVVPYRGFESDDDNSQGYNNNSERHYRDDDDDDDDNDNGEYRYDNNNEYRYDDDNDNDYRYDRVNNNGGDDDDDDNNNDGNNDSSNNDDNNNEQRYNDEYEDDWDNYGHKKEYKEQVLKGLPFVMLQSCNSLDQSMADYIFSCGGVGLIGTTTNVHSGSGSSILKAICDDILYRNLTVGEALGNARNYFLCLMKLKQHRKHKQIAKAKRVALSFRLWGDPELKILKISRKKKNRKPVISSFDVKNNTYTIETPVNWLPKCETTNYYSRMFHDAKVAGLVKSVKDKDQRRVMQLFFFKEKLPKDWLKKNAVKSMFTEKYKDQIRTVFLPSEDDRYLYVLHFPNVVDKKQTIEFTFSKDKHE